MVVTECGHYHCDVLGVSTKECIEIETKISRADLRADRAKIKHRLYSCDSYWTPNRFYFLVPEHLRDDALAVAAEINPAYGVMTASDITSRNYGANDFLTVQKRAANLHNLIPSGRLRNEVISRMSSEIVGWHVHSWGERCSVALAENLSSIVGAPALEEVPA